MKNHANRQDAAIRSRILPLAIIALMCLLTIVPSLCYPRDTVPEQERVSPSDTIAEMQTVTPSDAETEEDEPVPDQADNPVDAFFDAWELDNSTSSNYHMTQYRAARADAWLAEVEHGYAMLEEHINPYISEEGQKNYREIIRRARESFLVYAEEGTYLEATVTASNTFAANPSEDDFIYAGTAKEGYHLWLKGDACRAEALRLYGMIDMIYYFEECPELFVFDAEEFMSTVTEKYDIVLAPAAE